MIQGEEGQTCARGKGVSQKKKKGELPLGGKIEKKGIVHRAYWVLGEGS